MKIPVLAMALAFAVSVLCVSDLAANDPKQCILKGDTWESCGLPNIFSVQNYADQQDFFLNDEEYSFGNFRVPWLRYAPNYLHN